MNKYDPQKIEKRWQKIWKESEIYKVKDGSNRKKFYCLDMFPYPSGEGLHVGHPKGYIATDVVARYKMLNGFNVLHPMGFDSFGLPAENYAIKNKVHPSVAVEKNIKRYKEQLEMFGFTYDWNREVVTSNLNYYKWTQWIFSQMFKKGLAYQSNEPINWCPSCKTGLANEDLEDGKCERCGTQVEKKPMRQWVLKITDYAQRLLDDLPLVNWEDSIVEMQKNWIGRSEGALIKFPISNFQFPISDVQNDIEVFTTRPDTLFGATFVVICPEHSLIAKSQKQIANYKKIEDYIKNSKNKSDLERTDLAKTKTGVEIKGIKAINPANNEEIPIFVADYVLPNYGTGAIMAVPAHDERDFEFAKKYDLSIKQVIEPVLVQKTDSSAFHEKEPYVDHYGIIVLLKHWKDNKYLGLKWRDAKDWGTLLTGDLDDNLGPEERALKEVYEETGYKHAKIVKQIANMHGKYYHVPKKTNRIGHTQVYYVELIDGNRDKICEDEKNRHELLWLTLDELQNFLTAETHRQTINIYKTGAYTGHGLLANSNKFNGMESEKAKDEITKFVGGKKTIQYKLKDWVFSRQRYWGEPFPIVYCEKCKKRLENSKFKFLILKYIENWKIDKLNENHAYRQAGWKLKIGNYTYSMGELANPGWIEVPENQLPVELPRVDHYEPTGTGESPLINIEGWVKTKCPKCGEPAKRETNTMPQWAGSSWYYLRYCDPKNQMQIANSQKLNYWLEPKGVDLYVGGAEHATRHLIYARFWHKFLSDIGVVPTKEPFYRLQHVGLINGEDGRKMSKRWGNVINPDDIIKLYGADALRCYEMFMGPFADSIAWSTAGVRGVFRFLEKVYKLNQKLEIKNQNENLKIKNLINKTIKKVTEDIEDFRFNTAISALMILVNEMNHQQHIDIDDYKILLQLLWPFAPHISDELWNKSGETKSIFISSWPKFQEINDNKVTIAVQINGKVRANIEIDVKDNKNIIFDIAKNQENIKKYLSDATIRKIIYIPGRILSIVT